MLDIPVTHSIRYYERFTSLEHIKFVNKEKVVQSCKTVVWPRTGGGKKKTKLRRVTMHRLTLRTLLCC
jgi:hypothetical protein